MRCFVEGKGKDKNLENFTVCIFFIGVSCIGGSSSGTWHITPYCDDDGDDDDDDNDDDDDTDDDDNDDYDNDNDDDDEKSTGMAYTFNCLPCIISATCHDHIGSAKGHLDPGLKDELLLHKAFLLWQVW